MPGEPAPFGALLRGWRGRRRQSQLDLSLGAEVSQRHVSFLESGRAAPSRQMVLRLAEALDVPLRERNALFVAAGFAPLYDERPPDDPGLAPARAAVERILAGHEPHPALAIDRRWTMIAANRAVAPLLGGAAPGLLAPPVNVLRLSLHPEGLAPRIRNYRAWRGHLLERLARQAAAAPDPALDALIAELRALPPPTGLRPPGRETALAGIAVPFELDHPEGPLAFLSATTVFGTALDVALAELAVEAFFPADARTAETMRRLVPPA